MKTETKILGATLIFSLLIILGATFFFSKGANTPTEDTKTVQLDYSKGQKIGSDSAKVKLAEFSDLQCPACKAAEPFVKQVREKYQQNFQFIYFHFPLMQHIHSKKAANFAEYAATEGKFWQIHDKLFDTQDSWSTLADPTDFFVQIGSQFGLDKDKIKQAVLQSTFSQKIDDNFSLGQSVGVDATPTFYLNGKKLKLKSFGDIDKAVEVGLQQN